MLSIFWIKYPRCSQKSINNKDKCSSDISERISQHHFNMGSPDLTDQICFGDSPNGVGRGLCSHSNVQSSCLCLRKGRCFEDIDTVETTSSSLPAIPSSTSTKSPHQSDAWWSHLNANQAYLYSQQSLDRGEQVIFGSVIILAIEAILALISILKIILVKSKAPKTKLFEMYIIHCTSIFVIPIQFSKQFRFWRLNLK